MSVATRLKKLETENFGLRIQRLREQLPPDPQMPEFDAFRRSLSMAEINGLIQYEAVRYAKNCGEEAAREELAGHTPGFIDWLLHGKATEQAAAEWTPRRSLLQEGEGN